MSVLQAHEPQMPWWHWVLLSTGAAGLVVGVTVLSAFGLAHQGADLADYLLLPRPPVIQSTAVAAWLGLLLAGQTVAPLVLFGFNKPLRGRMSRLFIPASPGAAGRWAAVAAAAVGLQVVWSAWAPPPAESWRLVEHLIYATLGGGRTGPLVILVVVAGLIIPIAEEVLFRGLLYGWLRRWGPWVAMTGSALLFGLPHGPAAAVPATVLGLGFAWLRERDGSLLGPALLHVLNNLAALLYISATL